MKFATLTLPHLTKRERKARRGKKHKRPGEGTPTQEKTGWVYKRRLRGKTSSLLQDSPRTKGIASSYDLPSHFAINTCL